MLSFKSPYIALKDLKALIINPFAKFGVFFSALSRITRILPSQLRRSIIYIFIYMTISGLVELLSIVALTLFFRLIYSPQFILELPLAQTIINRFSAVGHVLSDPKQVMIWGCLLPVVLIILKNIMMARVAWKSSFLSEKVAAYAGNTIMKKYLAMPYSWHLSAQQALALIAMQRRFSLGALLLSILIAFSNIITAALLFGGLFFYAPIVTIGTVFFMGLISVGTFALLKKHIDKAGIASANESKSESLATQTALSGVREIIIYQMQAAFLKEISNHVEAGIAPRTFLSISPTVPTWTLESGGFFLIWVTIYCMVNYTSATHAMVSETIALLALTAWRILPSLNRVVSATVKIKTLQPSAFPCLDYLESLKAADEGESTEEDKNFKIQKYITFDHISFAYPSANSSSSATKSGNRKLALKDICCTIPLGTTIGLVGRSGSGKSTFINILCGLLEPTQGKLLADGKTLTSEQLISYRKKIGYVPQNPYLLRGSVAQNVAFKDWCSTINRDQVQLACKLAAIDFLGKDCANIDIPTANSLSGGQMQRVSIARALYGDPAILIFDEATSALDQLAEGKIQEAMKESHGLRTNIIAAHRLETLEICDIIFWLENGVLIKAGTGKEILREYRDAIAKTFQ